MHKVICHGSVQMVSTVKGKPLTPVEQVQYTFEHSIIDPSNASSLRTMEAVAEAEMRMYMVKLFRNRIANDPSLKHKIGGTRWSVELRHFDVELGEKIH